VNGTDEPNTIVSFLGSQFPPWDRRLDLVIATHTDDDNLSSLNSVLARFDVGTILEPPQPPRPGAGYQKWRNLLSEQGISAHVAQAGTRTDAGVAEIEIVGSPSSGDSTTNLALRIITAGQPLLLAPSLTANDQKLLAESAFELDAIVAVLPPHLDKGFLDKVNPETVVLFVGGNLQDTSTEALLRRLEHVRVLRTAEEPHIELILTPNQ
jgi:beta-lactamase superfamily II metal-dependent hydrolase